MKGNGKVFLVGAGPGDPGLITVRGRRLLQDADVVVYDRLIPSELLDEAPDAEKIDVGKRQGCHPVPQEEINEILCREAKKQRLVIRLKGGDPYLFGRGAEEAAYLRERNVPFQVVPGVTSAIAALGYAGIPATPRQDASSVHIITGHAKSDAPLNLNFEALCRVGGTLVFLMALGSLEQIVGGLLEAGMPGDTPCAAVEHGTLPAQRKLAAALTDILTRVREAKIQSPAVFAVGPVCDVRKSLDWFEELPLFGRTVIVTRPREEAGALAVELRSLGARVVALPCIETQLCAGNEAREAVREIHRYSWLVLTSRQGVEHLFSLLASMELDARALAPVRIAAIGQGTAEALSRHGIRADYLPSHYDAAHLAQGLTRRLRDRERLLLLRAERGTPELPALLKKHGAVFDDVALYQARYHPCENREEAAALLKAGGADYVTFTSPSTVEGFDQAVPGAGQYPFTGVCIGKATQAAAREKGYGTLCAANATVSAMIDVILEEEKR